MAGLVWGDQYKIGFKGSDDQHQELVRMIGDLSDAIKANQDKAMLEKLLGDLIKYTANHFSMEERMMQTHAYPEKDAHTKEHEDLKNTVIELQKKFKDGKSTVSLQTIHFLNDWLCDHILKTDKRLAVFLNSKGIK